MDIGKRLAELRLQKGLTQGQLSKLSSVTQPLISKIEAGIRPNPTNKTLQKLCDALDVSMAEFDENKEKAAEMLPLVKEEMKEYLVDHDSLSRQIENVSDKEIEETIREVLPLVEKFNSLSAKNKKAITTLIDSLISGEK